MDLCFSQTSMRSLLPRMQAVKDSEPLRTAVDEVQPERVKLSLRLSQSKPLYEAYKGIKEGDLWGQLSEAQQRIVGGEMRDFVLGGVALEVYMPNSARMHVTSLVALP